ncbi:uncharacterized protein LOC131601512 [Vicia villosa]|uniref:uncharacterized protein LOC131601512 n=1 Tax=Vicia villosa TaxID=3911 RepID=UPI00273B91FE|nr:uncharacterized protein LOC131601512 [Vicia villosa]
MKTKIFIFVFFLCALIINSCAQIESSKDIGATKEFKPKIGIRERAVYTGGWTNKIQRGGYGKDVGGGKKGGPSSGGSIPGGGAQGVGEQNGGGKDKGSEPARRGKN